MNAHKQDGYRKFPIPSMDNSYFLSTGLVSYNGGMDLARKLIEDRINALGLNYTEVSRRLHRNETYLQQFLKKGSPRELRERERHLLAEILKVSEEDLRGPSTPLPKRSYEKKASGQVESSIDRARPVAPQSGLGNATVPSAELFGVNDLPVYGTTPGQDGALIVSELAIDWVARPAMLMRVRDGYGVIVSDDLMAPEHKMGSIALVNPHLPARIGSSCVFRSKDHSGKELVLIREYRGQTDTHWK